VGVESNVRKQCSVYLVVDTHPQTARSDAGSCNCDGWRAPDRCSRLK